MNGWKYFTKLDLNHAFFQFEISDESKALTTFYGRLVSFNRLPQGVLPACSELNNARKQFFSEVQEVKVIHDDVIIATKTLEDQYIVLDKIFNIIN